MIMKKILLMAAFAVATLTANAQFYVGGNLGFKNNKEYTSSSEKTISEFNIAPEVGTALNDKWGIGIKLGVGFDNEKTETTVAGATTTSELNSTTITVKPYARYQAFQWGKANFFCDGGVYFQMKSKKDFKPGMDLQLYVAPGVAFNVSEKWSIVASLTDFFRFGYEKKAILDVAGQPDPNTNMDANLGLGSFDLGGITFGVFYNF